MWYCRLDSKGSWLWRKYLRKLWKYQFHFWNIYSKPKGRSVVCLFEILPFVMDFRGVGLSEAFHLIFSWRLEIWMGFCECISECVCVNVIAQMCFQFAFSPFAWLILLYISIIAARKCNTCLNLNVQKSHYQQQY